VVSLIHERSKPFLSFNSLPVLILSCHSLLLDHIQAVYALPVFVTAFHQVFLNGIIDIRPPSAAHGRRGTRPVADAEFVSAIDRLFTDGVLMRRVVETFSTDDVFTVERRRRISSWHGSGPAVQRPMQRCLLKKLPHRSGKFRR
jgi:hypothetical protein